MSPTIFISAGEASGEHYGALLAAALERQLAAGGQTGRLVGMGGERMKAAGVECVVRSEDMAVMGLTEVVKHLPRIYGEFRKLKKAIRERRPDVAVLIDFPEIHFKLAREFHRLGIPVIFFVSPQLWAWKKHRIRLVQQFVRRMLVIFPFEEPFYRENGVEAEFVGHPLAELGLPAVSREEFAAENRLDAAKTWIGLLPGSRAKEIADHLAEMLRAARRLASNRLERQAGEAGIEGGSSAGNTSGAKALDNFGGADARAEALAYHPPASHVSGSNASESTDGGFEFIVPLAPTLHAEQRAQVLEMVKEHGNGLAVRLVDDARGALKHARASVVASGTATVEAALIGNPFVVVYRVSALTYAIAKRVVKVPHVAMANLIAGKRVVPELIQHDFTAENIAKEMERLLPEGAARESMMEELAAIREALSLPPGKNRNGAGGAIERVAAITLDELKATSCAQRAMAVQS